MTGNMEASDLVRLLLATLDLTGGEVRLQLSDLVTMDVERVVVVDEADSEGRVRVHAARRQDLEDEWERARVDSDEDARDAAEEVQTPDEGE